MKIIGLTGSIAAGKSTIAKWFNELRIAVHDSDRAVHELLGPGGDAVEDVLTRFGSHFGSVASGINRQSLGDYIFAVPQKRKTLESILHPMVQQHRDAFIAQQRRANVAAIVLDVPLLFETGAEVICDYVIVVHASANTISERALARVGMTEEKLASILSLQMLADEKKLRADLVLDSDMPKDETRNHLVDWLSAVGLFIVVDDIA